MAGGASVSSRLVAKLMAGVGALGGDPAALVASVGLEPALLADRDGRVPHERVVAFLRRAGEALGDDALGLHLAELVQRSADNVLRIAVHSSPTVAEAFQRFGRYSRLVHDGLEVGVSVDGASARFSHHNAAGEERHGVELSLGMATLFCRAATRGAFRVDEVTLVHPAPRAPAEHTRVFGAPVRFGRAQNQIVFPRALLDLPLAEADPALASHLDRHLDALLAQATRPPGFGETVRRCIGADLRGGVPRMNDVAKKLHMSARTLQRRLGDAGLSFQDLVVEVRRELSVRYLETADLALAEVAFLVGFSEASTFHRAFKQWTGVTPAEYRRQRPPLSPPRAASRR